MAEENTAEVSGDVLSAEDQKYFDTKGASDETTEQSKPEDKADKAEATKTDADKAKAAQDADDAEKAKNPGQWVRHGAFHEEREKRKAAQSELQAEREKYARLDERLNLLTKAMTPPQEERKAVDPKEDIFGAVAYLMEQVNGLGGKVEEANKTVAMSREEQSMVSEYKRDVQGFVSQNKDFAEAYSFLFSSRDREYQALGFEDPQERARMIEAEEKDIVSQSLKAKASPSARIYALAKARGYQAKAPLADETDGGKDVKVNIVKDEKTEAAEKIDKIAAAQNATKSLSNGGGGAAELSLAALDAMSEEEFAATLAKMPKAKQREYLGG